MTISLRQDREVLNLSLASLSLPSIVSASDLPSSLQAAVSIIMAETYDFIIVGCELFLNDVLLDADET